MALTRETTTSSLLLPCLAGEREASEEAYIIKVKERSVIVLVPRFGIEGIVQIESKVDEGPRRFSHDEKRETLTSVTDPACVLRTFDKVRAPSKSFSLSSEV